MFLLQEACSQTSGKNSLSSHRKGNSIRTDPLPPPPFYWVSSMLCEKSQYHDFWRSIYVFFQILTNATKPMQLKGTNAIWMPLVLICRAHTIALVTLITSVMVLIVKVRLTFSMTLSLSRQVLDRPSLNHCRSGGHFWPNKANWSSH